MCYITFFPKQMNPKCCFCHGTFLTPVTRALGYMMFVMGFQISVVSAYWQDKHLRKCFVDDQYHTLDFVPEGLPGGENCNST
jgi:hypothetical protein